MKQKRQLLTCICLFFLILNGLAQTGNIDYSFNPADNGMWKKNSLDGAVTAICVQNDGKILVAGNFSRFNEKAIGSLVRFNPEGTLDTTFQNIKQYPFNIYQILVQPNGKIVIAGSFGFVNGIKRNCIARLNENGSLDNSFDPGTGIDGSMALLGLSLVLQNDGKIIIGGYFHEYNGIAVNQLVRVLSNGGIDTSYYSTGVDGNVRSIVLQDDGKIVIGGTFTKYSGTSINHLARINPDGSLDNSFTSGLSYEATSSVNSIFLQQDKKLMITGSFKNYGGSPRNQIARVNEDGSLDGTFQATSGIFSGGLSKMLVQSDFKIIVLELFATKSTLQRLNQDGTLDTGFQKIEGNKSLWSLNALKDGRFIVGGYFTALGATRRNYIACVKTDGTIDLPFNVEGMGVNGIVYCSAIQKDGKIVIGGVFSHYNDKAASNLVRLHPDGAMDTTFHPKIDIDDNVLFIAIQSDGKLVICGSFDVNTPAHKQVMRLNTDGSTDTTFSSILGSTGYFVEHASIQTDGKIIIGGSFTNYQNFSLAGIGRLNKDGTVDTTFKTGTGVDILVQRTAIQPDGKILIVGYFTTYNGTNVNHLARLNVDGSIDNSFHTGTGPDDFIQDVYVQKNGQLIIAGTFKTVNGKTANQIARINSDGSVDTTFSTGSGVDIDVNGVYSISGQTDGKIIAAGYFTSFNGVATKSIVRLNVNGSLDNSFDPGLGIEKDKYIFTTTIQPDEKIIIGGNFTSYNGTGRNKVARIHGNVKTGINDESLSQALVVFPNPSTGLFQLKLERETEIIVYDLYGKIKFHQSFNSGSQTLDLSAEKNGVYFIKAVEKGKAQIQKIIVAK